MDRIYRYDETTMVSTSLDPLPAAISWIRGLRSTGYVSDILEARHGFSNAKAIHEAARAIAAHAEIAISFLEQAFAGAPELSYLPIYYALLNLAKASIIANGRLTALSEQRLHGATWSGISTSCHNLLTDHITLMGEGAIPLFYQTLTNTMWPDTRQKTRDGNWILTPKRCIPLRNIYPYIVSVSHEYVHVYGITESLAYIEVFIKDFDAGSARLVIEFPRGTVPTGNERRKIKVLTGLHLEDGRFVSRAVTASSAVDVRKKLTSSIRRYLLYDHIVAIPLEFPTMETVTRGVVTATPISGSSMLLPEELPIILAFFHLSNVVRYDPERLKRLFDSNAVGLLEALIRHATFQYLMLFWSYINQKTFFIVQS